MRLSSTQARKMLFAAIPSIHNLIFGLIVFYILGYNNLMFATIYQNSKFILELRIGWDGVSITPLMVNPAPSDSAHWDTAADSGAFESLIRKSSGVMCIYMLGHFVLFISVLTHNWHWDAISFDLSLQDVRLSPKPPN
ncbi:hypothetical protein GmHk_U059885 (mitochondrion) [Glycine max]|nr:hypothetical protein GmHk_U059990 [Glycine max]KAH1188188.1 hypothetical protein GmHk_U059885 [Glycine max]